MHGKSFVIIAVTVIVTLNPCFFIIECKRVKRVIRGTEVECGNMPRIASLRNASDFSHLCGTTILTAHIALTAAHCVHHAANQYLLQLNNYCVNDGEPLPKAEILEVIIHELYDKYSRAHDIAVLRINNPDLDDVTWLKCTILPISSFGVSGECIIYGYGTRSVDITETSEKLLASEVNIISLDKCLEQLGPYVAPHHSSGMMCALGYGDTCQGDSGSPLICANVLQGISSHGLSCGVPGVPGIYTNIGAHLPWLYKIMQQIEP